MKKLSFVQLWRACIFEVSGFILAAVNDIDILKWLFPLKVLAVKEVNATEIHIF